MARKKKEEQIKEVQVEVPKEFTLEVDGGCSHCGKTGYKVTLKFCSEACRDAFISNHKL